jgi:hypothetical protein
MRVWWSLWMFEVEGVRCPRRNVYPRSEPRLGITSGILVAGEVMACSDLLLSSISSQLQSIHFPDDTSE